MPHVRPSPQSVGGQSDAARARSLGISTYLTKPVRQSVLLDAILSTTPGDGARRARQTPNTVRRVEPTTRALRVLLAEDNSVNRRVVTALLAKREHVVTAVVNGRQAVLAVKTYELFLDAADGQPSVQRVIDAVWAFNSGGDSA